MRGTSILGPKISKEEFEGCEKLMLHAGAAGFSVADVSYVLATAFWETKGTMQPVKEAYWLSPKAREAWLFKMYDINGSRPDKARELGNFDPGDGVKYGGMGYPQVTGGANYRKLHKALGIDLTNHPELMLQPDVAAQATIYGMASGLFTGKKLNDFLPENRPATREEFKRSRSIINGTDKDDEIADVAIVFQQGVIVGEWKEAA